MNKIDDIDGLCCRVGARAYHVSVKCDEVLEKNENANGYISYASGKIVLRPVDDFNFILESLMHELLHAMLDDTGLHNEMNSDSMERFVSMLTPRLRSFCIDNPDIVLMFLSR